MGHGGFWAALATEAACHAAEPARTWNLPVPGQPPGGMLLSQHEEGTSFTALSCFALARASSGPSWPCSRGLTLVPVCLWMWSFQTKPLGRVLHALVLGLAVGCGAICTLVLGANLLPPLCMFMML